MGGLTNIKILGGGVWKKQLPRESGTIPAEGDEDPSKNIKRKGGKSDNQVLATNGSIDSIGDLGEIFSNKPQGKSRKKNVGGRLLPRQSQGPSVRHRPTISNSQGEASMAQLVTK